MRRGLSRHNNRSSGSVVAAFTPLSLFADGSQGAWYDDSNMSTLFQDSAGTTPAVLESPVGLQLDLSKNGVGSNGPQRYNLLSYTEQFSNVYWNKSGTSAGTPTVTTPSGTITLTPLTESAGANSRVGAFSANLLLAGNYTAQIVLKNKSGARFQRIIISSATGSFAYITVDLVNGVITQAAANAGTVTGATGNLVALGSGFYQVTLSAVLSSSQNYLVVCSSDVATPPAGTDFGFVPYTGDGTSGFYVGGADIRQTSQVALTPIYQPITSSWAATIAGNHRSQATSANRPLLSARYNLLLGTAALATQSITTVATSYTIYFTGSGTVTLSGTFIGVFTAGTNTFTATAGSLTATVAGSVLTADIRPTNQTVTLPAYQAVVNSTTYDTVGFPQYIRYNGSNQFLSTASIDFTATAQMSVFAGVRKLGVVTSVLVELSTAYSLNSGSFAILPSATASSEYGFYLNGTAVVSYVPSGFLPPITNTLTALLNIAGVSKATAVIPYVNNVLSQSGGTGTTAGTGNFGNYALYFGMRLGGVAPFNGQEYQMIIVGKTLTAAQITSTETYTNSKTKAY